jgi:hypothetical protein
MEKLISVLIPSRNRPQGLRELCDSLFNNANNPNQIEVIVYFDLDDSYIPEYVEYFNELTLKYTNPVKTIIGPKLVLSDYPNKLLQIASSDIFMNLGDDMRCKAKGWDEIIIEAINEYPDKINFVYVDDGYWGPNLASHHIIHRNYVECLGYFYPPFFDFGYSDAWMFQVAQKVGRIKFLPILFEHMHYSIGKGDFDQTYQDKLEKNQNNIYGDLFVSTEYLRDQDVKKLQSYIKSFV